MSDNVITLVGNVVRDFELRFTPSGQAIATSSIAVNKRWRDNVGEWREAVTFMTIVAWRELAENCAESLYKGARIIVTGTLDQESFETPGGERRTSHKLTASEIAPSLRWANVNVIRNERRDGGAYQPAQPQPQPQQPPRERKQYQQRVPQPSAPQETYAPPAHAYQRPEQGNLNEYGYNLDEPF